MWISPAYAQVGGGGGDMFSFFVPIILIFVVFWFLLIRPQQQKQKRHQAMLSNITRNNRVVTGGGIVGTVTKVSADDNELTVEIADNVRVKVLRYTISEVLSKPDPAARKAAKSGPEEERKGGLLEKLGLK